jgi:hypothetical protein
MNCWRHCEAERAIHRSGAGVEVRVTDSLGEVPVLDRIHFGRAELTAL